jgi:hypothetical protein
MDILIGYIRERYPLGVPLSYIAAFILGLKHIDRRHAPIYNPVYPDIAYELTKAN